MQKSCTLGSVGGGFRKESVYPTELTYYYYETVNNGKYFLFMFMIGNDEWDPSYEKIYDEIVEKTVLNKAA